MPIKMPMPPGYVNDDRVKVIHTKLRQFYTDYNITENEYGDPLDIEDEYWAISNFCECNCMDHTCDFGDPCGRFILKGSGDKSRDEKRMEALEERIKVLEK